jgi:hypothetical protein
MTKEKPSDAIGVQGEGNYDSARRHRKDVETFGREKGDRIPEMAKDAERALEGTEGAELKKAEEKGKSKARH